MDALEQARTTVCEPTLRVTLEAPVSALSAVTSALGRAGAAIGRQSVSGDLTAIEALVRASSLPDLQRQLPALAGGEGVLEAGFDHYDPVHGDPPTRQRASVDPRRRVEYVASVRRGGGVG